MARRAILSAALLACFAAWIAADSAGSADRVRVNIVPHGSNLGAPPGLRADLRIDVPLVLIPVHVTTALGNTVSGLSRTNFRLFEDGVEQTISHFFIEDSPASIGLLLDTSGSMRDKIRKSCDALTALLKFVNPEDETFLIEFNEKPRLTVPFTDDSNEVARRMLRASPFGRTSLLDAIYLALSEMKHARNGRKAIVILSDGGDNHSRHSEAEVKDALREADVQLYAMGIFQSEGKPPTREERDGPDLLDELASVTGGKLFTVESVNQLPDACARIGRELRDQYVLGYAPTNPARDGKYRHIKVTLVEQKPMPAMKAFYRLGYYAPID